MKKDYTIAVAGTGYVGLSIATLLSQHHKVMAVDIVKEKVDLINNRKSPIQDDYIEKYLAEKALNLTATLDAKEAYSNADFLFFVNTDRLPSILNHSPYKILFSAVNLFHIVSFFTFCLRTVVCFFSNYKTVIFFHQWFQHHELLIMPTR